jgi:hypothetical protein
MAIQSGSVKEKDIAQNRELIESNPIWQGTRLSRELCWEWEWFSHPGQVKDVACRTLLIELEALGCLTFPKGQGTSSAGAGKGQFMCGALRQRPLSQL